MTLTLTIDRANPNEMIVSFVDPNNANNNIQTTIPITINVNPSTIRSQNGEQRDNPFAQAENNYSAHAYDTCEGRTATMYPLGEYQITGVAENPIMKSQQSENVIDMGNGKKATYTTTEMVTDANYGDNWLITKANDGRDDIHITPFSHTFGCIGLTGEDMVENMNSLIDLYNQNESVDPGSSYVVSQDSRPSQIPQSDNNMNYY